MNKQQVCAVVVTYNRKELLLKCLDGVLKQTRAVERVLIIDNASTDGTFELLSNGGYLDNASISYVRLPANIGGAGGFHEGFKRAFAQGYDWLWAMDDDGLPREDTLERLLAPSGILFRGPLIIASEDAAGQKLAFDYWVRRGEENVILRTREELEAAADDEGLLWNHLSPFNGVLVSREVIERIGLPHKDFFLWGDEWDFFYRAQKAGVSIATVVDAIFWHPANKMMWRNFKILNRKFDLPYADSPFRNYLLIRNHAYLASRHKSFNAWCKFTAKHVLYYSAHFRQLSPLNVLIYSLEGLRGNLHGHQKFLKAPKG
ncbi:MAG: glycosyltransferase family 2 protein [Acidobacteria bacterium]|nr:glycosyltransferase family 2 protein [Acidobacteriota bacterium]